MADTIIEMLIDESGSMGYMKGDPKNEGKYLVDGLTRMTLVKKVIIDEIIPIIDYATQITIRTFRTNDSKEAEGIIIPIIYSGSFDKHRILEVVTSIQDPQIGGTPITAAIKAAISDLVKHPNADRKIILLTDGEENGPGDYRLAAKQALELEGIPCKIFIIGIDQNEVSEKKSKEIATGGYYNIKSKSFTLHEIKKVLAPLKTVVLQNTIQNIQSVLSSSQPKPQSQPQKTIEKVEEKIETLKQESKKTIALQLEELEIKIREQISNTQKLLSELSSVKELLMTDILVETGIDSTTLTLNDEYSENLRQQSETFLYKLLCNKYGASKVKWLNEKGESFNQHDFELLDDNEKTIQLIECKGTAKDKATFYLTANEWSYFLTNKEVYQIYRVFNVEGGEMNAVCIDNLLASILNGQVVPYLLKIEILKEHRVFLTLTH